ncbi:hypothetical protein C8Q80DRAFT_858124 [Daedaleopsis nitida]|nr:hypothetical protein C8Q80DRAFT_858124 [Daedaleopsis nitida]
MTAVGPATSFSATAATGRPVAAARRQDGSQHPGREDRSSSSSPASRLEFGVKLREWHGSVADATPYSLYATADVISVAGCLKPVHRTRLSVPVAGVPTNMYVPKHPRVRQPSTRSACPSQPRPGNEQMARYPMSPCPRPPVVVVVVVIFGFGFEARARTAGSRWCPECSTRRQAAQRRFDEYHEYLHAADALAVGRAGGDVRQRVRDQASICARCILYVSELAQLEPRARRCADDPADGSD